jgi:hypothetical protein
MEMVALEINFLFVTKVVESTKSVLMALEIKTKPSLTILKDCGLIITSHTVDQISEPLDSLNSEMQHL